jgi:phosphoserine phosphatase
MLMTHSFVITLIANPSQVKLEDSFVKSVEDNLRMRGVAVEKTQWLAQEQACDLYVNAEIELDSLASLQGHNIDSAIQHVENRRKKLLISDMDSTIIQQECIDELAGALGIGEKVAEITERAMNGELDFPSALRERVGLLKGLPESALSQVYAERIMLMGGAKTLVQTMKKHGAHTMLVSGGFTFFTGRIRDVCGFHEDEANVLGIADGALTGMVHEPILDKQAKLAALHRGCREHGVTAEDVLAVGDGANDLPMLQAAGLGVGYHGKKIVQDAVKVAVNHADLHALLYLQGYHSSEFVTG